MSLPVKSERVERLRAHVRGQLRADPDPQRTRLPAGREHERLAPSLPGHRMDRHRRAAHGNDAQPGLVLEALADGERIRRGDQAGEQGAVQQQRQDRHGIPSVSGRR